MKINFAKSGKLLFFCRSSHPELFCKKGALRNFTKFTGKHLCQSFLQLYWKRDSGACVFLYILWNFYRTPPVAVSDTFTFLRYIYKILLFAEPNYQINGLANRWTGFYMITDSVLKRLRNIHFSSFESLFYLINRLFNLHVLVVLQVRVLCDNIFRVQPYHLRSYLMFVWIYRSSILNATML